MTKEHYPCCSELLIASWAISFHPQLIHYSSAVRKWLQPRTFQKACVSTAAQDSTRGSTSTQPGGTPVLGFKEPSEIPHWLSPGGRHVFHNENLDFQRKLGTSQIIPWLKSSDPQHLWYQAGTGFMVHEQEVGDDWFRRYWGTVSLPPPKPTKYCSSPSWLPLFFSMTTPLQYVRTRKVCEFNFCKRNMFWNLKMWPL